MSSVDTIWAFNSSRIRWAGHVARVGERRYVCRSLFGTAEGERETTRIWEDTSSKRRLKKYETELSGFIWLRKGASDRYHNGK